ncbi:ubiquinone biosynthesis hydrox [Ascobolus immersus RN42]|uniref:Ubiquinone biosynthesis monooxygenase COQ6, mitochondrial n=1 Tax=Ascobolus immersus RN42 TaxID=1160509 RepID=A0A3N4IQY4_ASCIM|nr:ubiquinone biosynthesis hydrox [Ascobolus immersus RN42]
MTAFTNRVSSLTPSSVDFINRIGAWNHLKKYRTQKYEQMHVWDGVSGAAIDFGDVGLEAPAKPGVIATMCENDNLVRGLLRRIHELGGVEMIDKTRVKSIGYGTDDGEMDLSGWPVVQLDNGRELTARLLVGADGQNSPVRTFAGIESNGWDYGRMGVVATLRTESAGENVRTAYQRFLPTGPIALLPMPADHKSPKYDYATLVWSTTPEIAQKLKSLPPAQFASMVNAGLRLPMADLEYLYKHECDVTEELNWRESVLKLKDPKLPPKVVEVQEGSVASFPLKMRHADSYIAERIALVGDAAHTTHPLAGQGLNLGIGDVECLVKTLEHGVMDGKDIGSVLSLEPYFSERYLTNHIMLGVVDKLHKLYGTDFAPVVAARSMGLSAVNSLGWVKNMLMKQAAGGKTLIG